MHTARTRSTLALTLGLAFVASILSPTSAHAIEGPEPDPVTIRVSMSAPAVRISVPVTTGTRVGRNRCASVWGLAEHLGSACATTAVVHVPVTIDTATWPMGQTTIWASDDRGRWSPVIVDARPPSRFGLGTWTDLGSGNLSVRAPLFMRSQATGKWVARPGAVVQVQKLVRGRWVLVKSLKTSRSGVAFGIVAIGGGIFYVRVVAQADWRAWSTAGTKRREVVTTEPIGPDGVDGRKW